MDNIFPIVINKSDFKVVIKITKDADAKQKAIANLTFGPFQVSGFRIQEGKFINHRGDTLWAQPPSYRVRDGQFKKTFWSQDKELWKFIEELILKKYDALLLKPEISMDDIPVINEDGNGGYEKAKTNPKTEFR